MPASGISVPQRRELMDFKRYVQSVVASYVEKQNRNVIFIKHYNTLDISKEEILACVTDTKDEVFLYHEYINNDMHEAFAPFLDWIRYCYNAYYKSKMSIETFLMECHVYPVQIEPLAGIIRNNVCTRKEDVLYFEIGYETERMITNLIGILDYISKQHHLILILSKFHLAPFGSIKLLRKIMSQNLDIHAIVMYNDEFNIAAYKKSNWDSLLQEADAQNLQLEWGSMDSEKTIDMQDEFWFDKSKKDVYLTKLTNMYNTFALEDAYYYMSDIMYRLDEKTGHFTSEEKILFMQLSALIDMSVKNVNQALVVCSKMTDLCRNKTENEYLKYMFYYIFARANMVLTKTDKVIEYCNQCVKYAEIMEDDVLITKAEILKLASYLGMCNDIFEYDFNYKVSMEMVEKLKTHGFKNFLAYLYVFGFENEPEVMKEIANGRREPYYFTLGVQMGKGIENDNLLMNAYMKNIILYSRFGYHTYVREMYKKRLSVLKRPNPMREAHMFAGLGYNSIILEDYEKAHVYLTKSICTLTELEIPDDIMNSLYNLAMNYFVAEVYQNTIETIDLILKMLKELGYTSIRACSTTKLYCMMGISCYYQEEYYNSYYYLSKTEVIAEQMLKVLEKEITGVWDEDLLLYHLLKAMLYSYEERSELCMREFDQCDHYMKLATGSGFLVMPIYAVEKAKFLRNENKNDEADAVLLKAIKYCEREGLKRKKKKLEFFLKLGIKQKVPFLTKNELLSVSDMMRSAKQTATQNKLEKREKDIKFLTVLQEAISRENMTREELFENFSAILKNNYNLDQITVVRRRDGDEFCYSSGDRSDLSAEDIAGCFEFFRSYRHAFLTNRVDKNFVQFFPVMEPFDKERIMTMIGIPVFEETGTQTIFLGCNDIKRRTVSNRIPMNSEDLRILKFAFSQYCEMMRRIDNRQMIEKMNHQLEQSAITDHLTGITNRNGFSRQLDIICSQKKKSDNVILYLDLDNFKYYNDTFGHEIGDLVLVCFAEMFKRMTEGKGLAVRYGGDEFIILLFNQRENDGVKFAEHIYDEIKGGLEDEISEKLNRKIDIPDNKKISCSIGISTFQSGSRDDVECALNHADEMLYYVKRNGKSKFQLYDPKYVGK